MKFIKFTVFYLLIFTSYLAYRFSQLEPNHLHAITLALGAVGGVFVAIVKAFISINDSNANEINTDTLDSN